MIDQQDIPATEKEYLVEKLSPSTDYEVSVKMRNSEGESPPAITLVTTCDKPAVQPSDEKITLVFGSEHKIMLQGPNYFFDPRQFIYETPELLTGMTFHIAKKLLFISHDTGIIYR